MLAMLLFAMRRRTDVRPFTIAAIGASGSGAARVHRPRVRSGGGHRATGITDPYLREWGDNWAAVFARSFLTNADNFAVGMLAAVLIVAMQQDAVKESLVVASG